MASTAATTKTSVGSTTETAATRSARRVAALRALARTTPGILLLLAVGVVLASVLAGALTAAGVAHRSRALDALAHRSGPLAVAAQNIYRALSDADATTNSGFLAGGQEVTADRARYTADIAQAGTALALATSAQTSAAAADPDSPVAVLTSGLPVYTGLVETARADNLQGFPVGAAYQREASNLMRTRLLPAAESLYRTQVAERTADQDSAGGFPWLELLFGLVLLAVLVVAQWFVWRRSRRRVNLGLALATAAAAISLLWVLLASLVVMASVHASRTDGSTQTDILTQARIAALNARADETLTLVARGAGGAYEKDYRAMQSDDDGLLDRAADLATDATVRQDERTARAAVDAWNATHAAVRTADDSGDYPAAVQLAVGTAPNGSAAAFDSVDRSLAHAISTTNSAFERNASDAEDALIGAVWAVIVLALVSAAGAVAGIWQRLEEYR
ncbi:hypothetical protein [Tsukamurella soli]|uniref:Secreted protein n=1 Tax=Tsukamurella soli TaxID=644556 RepID=A0ABP8KJS2_9ACTN